MSKMKPALFNTQMVRAMLAGDKSATRRIIRPQPKMQLAYIFGGHNCGKWTYPPPRCVEESGWEEKYRRIDSLTEDDIARYWTPPCNAGDVLYVRETFIQAARNIFWYKADDNPELNGLLWKPSIHMPRNAARLFLMVTGVHVERLQEITEEQAIAEGAYHGPLLEGGDFCISAIDSFREIWNGTIAPKNRELYGWEANPWVWVTEFKEITREEAYQREGTNG